ncbi:electron transfer protein with DM13 domain [Nostoc sp. PCC 7524]|uniref:DM13 domain-containing protein n=1 Tax=Nostoc sp. (strain ATCC 29411 / PCC 7524) TaxID=28072 RepID=UPI00029EDA91|nr:DM13 domain-containing protein [Nostoc sp. PCC 7524]AFY47817.1 electron transfer protein with DM13 domain [Nostoc sp. PCC 7524]
MKAKQLIILGLTSLFMVSCVREPSNQQSTTNSTSANATLPVESTQGNTPAQSAKTSDKTTIKSGTFVSGEHTTQGTVRIKSQDGKSFLELDQSFKTSTSGPDLVVVLHRSDNVISSTKPPSYSLKEGDYIVIAPLQKFSGNQTYLIPNDINLAEYKSAAIWCRKFNATFGAASLSS